MPPKIALPQLLLVASCLSLLGLVGCRTGIRPHTPRVASGSGYQLALTRSYNVKGISDPSRGAQRVLLRVDAFPEGSQIVGGIVSRAHEAPCRAGCRIEGIGIRGRERSTRFATPLPGETLEVDLSQGAWSYALRGPARLDLALEDREGVRRCAAFALIGEAPEQRWDAVGSWTMENTLSFEFLQRRVEGLEQLVLFGVEVGKWLGPVRVHAASGAGAAVCSRDVCPPMKSDSSKGTENDKYYVPLLLGVGGTLVQLGPFALEGKLQYRVAWTAAQTFEGLERVFLHGPVATPSIVFTGDNPIVPGIPGGTRRGLGLGVQAPLGYVWSGRGQGSFSVGGSLVLMFPLH